MKFYRTNTSKTITKPVGRHASCRVMRTGKDCNGGNIQLVTPIKLFVCYSMPWPTCRSVR